MLCHFRENTILGIRWQAVYNLGQKAIFSEIAMDFYCIILLLFVMGILLSRFIDLFDFFRWIVRNDRWIVLKDEARKEFVYGIQSLDKAIEVIYKAEISGTTPAKRVKAVVQNMRRPINQAYKHLTLAKHFWEGEKARQCKEIERRISTMNGVKNTVSEEKRKIERMNEQLRGLNEQINDSERNVDEARGALSRAQESLGDAERKLRDKKNEKALVFGLGIAALAIPYVGLVVGPTMMAVSLTALENNVKSARHGVSSAENNVEDCENGLKAKIDERDSLFQQLGNEEYQKEETEQELMNQEQQLKELQNAQRRSVELCDKLMKTCHVMTNIWGKSQVLNNEARLAYALEPLLTPLKEIVDMFTPEEQRKIKENTFLLSRRIHLPAISLKLKAVAEASHSASVMEILDDYT